MGINDKPNKSKLKPFVMRKVEEIRRREMEENSPEFFRNQMQRVIDNPTLEMYYSSESDSDESDSQSSESDSDYSTSSGSD
ncbi:uncharacterized protein LOC112689937 isoform X2 [Sipha flava]|uniref:Uncharacterized protein LOC112689937 isoform X2 n=1 Tax=Sipha flava TaxID=143950 RepID=A0A8B8G8R9_9HEMI|nr:uncharacterized protein LOC112689937 isoform X2 [Sipha flava]